MTGLILVALFACGNMLFTDFIGDDIGRILFSENSFKGGWSDVLQGGLSDRPLMMFTIWLNYLVGGMNPFGYKLVNVLIHIFCGITVFFLFKEILKKAANAPILSFLIAALFLAHPINNQAVNTIIQRGVGLSTLFALLSFLFFIYAFTEGYIRKYFLMSVLFFLLAVAAKPNTAILPLTLALYYILEIKGNWRQLFKILLPYLLVLAVPVFYYFIVGENAQYRAVSGITYFLIQTKVILFYFQKYFLPVDLQFYYYFNNTFPQPPDVFTVLALLFHITFLATSFYQYKKKGRVWGLFILLGYLALMPESGFFSIMHPAFDHRNYFPLIFFAAAFVLAGDSVFNRVLPGKNISYKVMGCLVVILALLNISYTYKISTYEKWIFYNLHANPTNVNFYTYTATSEALHGHKERSLRIIDESFIANPESTELPALKKMVLFDSLPADQKKNTLEEISASARGNPGFSRFVFNYYELFLEENLRQLFSREEYIYKMNDFYQSFWPNMLKPATPLDAIERMKGNMIEVLKLNNREHPAPETFFEGLSPERGMLVLKNLLLLGEYFNYPDVDKQQYEALLQKNFADNSTAKDILIWLRKNR